MNVFSGLESKYAVFYIVRFKVTMLAKSQRLIKIVGNSFILLLFCFLFTSMNLEKNGIRYFSKSDYKASSKNWCISSTSSGFIYFANHEGLLEFDGISWQLHSLTNQTILRAVEVQNDSVIYTSGYEELGYWERDIYGNLNYFSLKEKAGNYISNNIEFWNIAIDGDKVYFQSFNDILVYQNNTISKVILTGTKSVMNKVGDKVLVAIRNEGIYCIKEDKPYPYVCGGFFKDKTIKFMLSYRNDQIMIGTAGEGIFIWNGEELKEWKPELTEYFSDTELNRGHVTKQDQLIFGTLSDGILMFNEDDQLFQKVNLDSGLGNNTVLGINSDIWGNVWLALDDGIGFVAAKRDRGVEIEKIPGIGAIYSAVIFNDKMYFATNQGLYLRSLSEKSNNLQLVPGTQAQNWECKIVDNRLWVGHNNGTFLVDGLNAINISDQGGGFSIIKDPHHDNQFIQCTYSDLVKYNILTDGSIVQKNINGFNNLIRYIEIDHLGNIWASHRYKGVYKLRTDDDRDKVIEQAYYDEKSFGKEFSNHVFKVENQIVFTTGNEIFTFDDLRDTIISYDLLNKQLGDYVSANRIVQAPNHHYWFICEESIGLFEINDEQVKKIKEFPISLFENTTLVDEFENIEPLTDMKAILCLQNGIAWLDASHKDSIISIHNFEPNLRNIEIYNRNKRSTLPVNNNQISKIKYNFNSLAVRFSFPQLTEIPISFQYKLEGLDNMWSQKTKNPFFRLERLPNGEFTLKVKAVDGWGNESKIKEVSFEILPPVYESKAAVFGYTLLIVLLLLGFRSWGIRQTRKKEQQQHEKREKELIRLRNEKLRNEIEFKSKELANSTMGIIKKNEFLMDLKNTLVKQKAELGSRYPDKYFNYLNKKIDENISSHHDWQVFETNFERAHEEFFKNIKEKFPELTSSDLRLCAFLRMNLASKEIAPLLGISVRGVENHRYRLRKKMTLKHDKSLTDVILSI